MVPVGGAPIRSTLPVVLLAFALVFAGCIGGSSDTDADPVQPAAPDDGGTDDGTSDGDDGTPSNDSDGSDGSGDAGGDGSGDTQDDAPRTPSDAMEQDPAKTGEGWARFDVEGTADAAVQVSVVAAEQTSYGFPVQVKGDVVRVEMALTWDPGLTDLNLVARNANDKTVARSAHGAEDIPGVLLVTPSNGTTWEYLDLTPDALGPDWTTGTWNLTVQEYNNLDTAGIQGTATGDGTPWTLQVWVYTIDDGSEHRPG